MKRNKFIASLFLLVSAPRIAFSKLTALSNVVKKAFKIENHEGRIHGHILLQGVNSNVLDVKVSGSDTDGQLAIFEQTSLSQGRGTPLHYHTTQDEIFYVIEGSYRFKVGDDIFQLEVGDSIFLPRMIPHAWTQVSEKGKMTVTVQPAGKLENFFIAISELTHEPTKVEIDQIFEANEMKVVGPPLKLE